MSGITVTLPVETYNALIEAARKTQEDTAEALEQLAIRMDDARSTPSAWRGREHEPSAIVRETAKALRGLAKKIPDQVPT